MAQQDFWSAAEKQLSPAPTPTTPSTAAPPPPTDFWSQAASQLQPAGTAPSKPNGDGDFWSQAEGIAPAKEKSDSVVGKVWDWANTPLVNLNTNNQSGIRGGIADVASGFTTPLSIGLTVGTLGAGPILKGLGVAVEEAGPVLKGIRALVDAGFTLQGAAQVAKESPRVLDALKEGDYETAQRLAVHVVAGTAMTALGVNRAGKDLGELAEDFKVGTGEKIRMSDTNKQIRRYEGVRQRETNESQDEARVFNEEHNKLFKGMSKNERAGTMFLMQAEGKPGALTDRINMLADAAGRSEERVTPGLPDELKPLQSRGLLHRGDVTAPGSTPGGLPEYHDFQDATTGGSISIKKGSTLDEAMAKVDDHRKSIDVSKLSDIAKTKQKQAAEAYIQRQRYQELIDQQNIKDKYTPDEIYNLLTSYKAALNPTPEMLQLARIARDKFTDLLTTAKDKGVVKSGIDHYITQLWQPEDLDTQPNNLLRDEANTGKFNLNVTMARKRIFENAFEGQLLGRKLKTADPITLVSNYINRLGEAIANRNFKENVLDNVRASDGRPIATLSGAGKLLEDEVDEDGKERAPVTLINPKAVRNIHIPDERIAALKASGELDRMIAQDKIIKTTTKKGKGKYVWNPHDYKSTGSGAMEDWNFGATSPDGTPVNVKTQYMIHPEGYEFLNRLLGQEKSPIQQMKPLNWLLKISGEAKHFMLSFSPFHIAQEGLRAIMTGIDPNPFNVTRMNINEVPELKTLVEEGLVRNKEHLHIGDFQQDLNEGVGGHSKIVNAIGKLGDKFGLVGKPLSIARDLQNGMTDFLFEKYIPALKERAALSLFERWKTQTANAEFLQKLQTDHPEFKGLTPERAAARLAALETNERFGGLNYRQMGRAVGTQDMLRLTTLAPDWLEGEIRSLKRVFDPTGGVMARRDLARMTSYMFAASRMLNMLISGKPHLEAPFGVVLKDKDGRDKVYSVRTLPTDMMHAATDPLGFLSGRESPLVRAGLEAGTGRDYMGRKLTPGAATVDIIRNNFVPIPGQAIGKQIAGNNPDLSYADQGVKALGGTAQVYRTQAQKLANELAANKTETGPVDDNKLQRHRAMIELENNIRSGQTSIQELHNAVEDGHISPKEAKQIQKTVQETREMDPELAKLYTHASRLPMKDFLQIWDAATPNEQGALAKLLIKKRQQYVTHVMKELSPAERKADPVYQRLKTMFPGAAPF